MVNKCSNPNCFVHEGESCAIGNMNYNECEHYGVTKPQEKTVSASLHDEASARVPWSGSTLGLSDLITLTPRARSILVGVMGAHDAGKTTLLLGNYLNCLRGSKIAGAEFAGSWTLGAWEALAAWLRFDDAARKPHFPPHTPRGAHRSPGLLHLGLRRQDQPIRDVLLTDAPGEWFTNWSINENAHDAEGARWTVEHADAFIVFADCARLSGAERGGARNDLRQLIERLGKYVDGRPVVMVWTKTDEHPLEKLSSGIRESIQRALKKSIPHGLEVSTTLQNSASFTEALATALDKAWQPELAKPIFEPVIDHHPFSAFRGYSC